MPIMNFKGGSAKTTTSVHLAQKCALEGLKTLLIDLDPQASGTFIASGIVPDLELDSDDTIYNSLLNDFSDINRVIRKTHVDRLDLIPSNLALQDCELGLPNSNINNDEKLASPALRLQQAIKHIYENYDVILIDCAPNLGILTINAILASNSLLIPIPPNMFDYSSFVMLTGTLKNLFDGVRASTGKSKSFDIFKILLTKHSGSNEAVQVESMLRHQFGNYVLTNSMCTTVEIEKATNDICTVYEIKNHRGSKEAYKRALSHLDAVNNEIISCFKEVWNNGNGDQHE